MTILFVMTACHHTGGGQGQLESPATLKDESGASQQVKFLWNSDADPSSGTLSAILSDGSLFKGNFMEIKQTLDVDATEPYYTAWHSPGWGMGPAWYEGSPAGFVTSYSGVTLASLRSDDGRRMRCKFVLRDPPSGFMGGAEGKCQLSDGATVYDAVMAGRGG